MKFVIIFLVLMIFAMTEADSEFDERSDRLVSTVTGFGVVMVIILVLTCIGCLIGCGLGAYFLVNRLNRRPKYPPPPEGCVYRPTGITGPTTGLATPLPQSDLKTGVPTDAGTPLVEGRVVAAGLTPGCGTAGTPASLT